MNMYVITSSVNSAHISGLGVTNEVHHTMLLNLVTIEEVCDAVNSIGALKTPGPDGLHASFYNGCWDTIKDSAFNLVKDFFENNSSVR